MRLLISIMVLSPLLLGATNSGGNDATGAADIIATIDNESSIIRDDTVVRVVDATDWRDYVVTWSTAMLAFFTIVLAVATIYYAIQTRENVKVSNKLLDSNRELIELNEVQNSIIKTQLLSKVYELSHLEGMKLHAPGWATMGAIEQNLGATIRTYLKRAAMDLLGEDFKRKVRVKLRDDYRGNKQILDIIDCAPGHPVTLPLIIWKHFQDIHGEDPDFEVMEYIDPRREKLCPTE